MTCGDPIIYCEKCGASYYAATGHKCTESLARWSSDNVTVIPVMQAEIKALTEQRDALAQVVKAYENMRQMFTPKPELMFDQWKILDGSIKKALANARLKGCAI